MSKGKTSSGGLIVRHASIKPPSLPMQISVWELLAARCAEESFENSQKRRGGQWNPYVHKMLRGAMRDYIIEQVKKPLMKALVTLAKRYLEPTHENVLHPNSHILIDIKEAFFGLEDNPSRKDLFEAIFKMFIAEYEHDGYYRYRLNWMLSEINKRNWQSDPVGTPHSCWKEER